MSGPLRLIVFDVDGTLVDSRVHILASMQQVFTEFDLPVPTDRAILNGVGLSLPQMMAQLIPDEDPDLHHRISTRYKALSLARHVSAGSDAESPFYPGMRELLDELRQEDLTLMATATGKSRRGLNRMIHHHGLKGYFQSTQVADNHPSKPHPSMLETALLETGVEPQHAVMIGDTSYDMAMAQAASMSCIAVTWGYQDRSQLADAVQIVDTATALKTVLNEWKDSLT